MKLTTTAIAGLTAVALASSGITASAADTTVLEKGHTDIFATKVVDGKLQLNLLEDITGSDVERAPESVLLKVTDKAWKDAEFFQNLETDVAQGAAAYLPQSQDQDVLWPGWEPLPYQDLNTISFKFLDVTGPGQVYLFQTTGNNDKGKVAMNSVFTDTGFELKTGSQIDTLTSHAHANWIFTKPGTYTMKVQATQGDLVSNEATYTWEVAENPRSAPSQPAPSQPAPSQPAAQSSLDGGAIAGIVIAIVALLGAAGAALSGMIPGLPKF
ncbi:choice-of-anchor M domain-containing protein [Corynebacterium phocae]|uniref:choice-of-anchor M domain-containing protein n=1 Tax=Corynebacterium phocae TaxID=161895 RepID=UPI000952EBE4|nr:choice-of-anchor M domain-containing protein [Corynebacterium phocae]KAA8726917.1 hypothetical protein F4V58_01840 [Corynebacterium phocae]